MAITAQMIGKLGGADVEEHPVSGVDVGGSGKKHPLINVPVSARTLVAIIVEITESTSSSPYLPQLYIGGTMSEKMGVGLAAWAAVVDTDTDVGIYTNNRSGTDFSGTVYVVPLD